MDVALIRHGKTQGNVERRYIGSTDEPLCAAGKAELLHRKAAGLYPGVQHGYVSPLLRCGETRTLLYPDLAATVLDGLREQAFGAFENRSYEELQFLPAYRQWLETAGESAIPGGEGGEAFRKRCQEAFCACVQDGLSRGCAAVSVITHGGVIMAMLSEYARPSRPFHGWQAQNGGGFLVRVEPQQWHEERTVRLLHEISGGEEA